MVSARVTTAIPSSVPWQAESRALGLRVTDTGVPLWLRASCHLLCLSFPTRLRETPTLRGDKVSPQVAWYTWGQPPTGTSSVCPQCVSLVPHACPHCGCPVTGSVPGVCPHWGCPHPLQVPGAYTWSPTCPKSVPTVPSVCPRCGCPIPVGVPDAGARSQPRSPLQTPQRRCVSPVQTPGPGECPQCVSPLPRP